MISLRISCLALLLVTQACQSPKMHAAPRDETVRAELLSLVKGLEGRWQVMGEGPASFIEFGLSSKGTAVREIMFPGTDEEMTNMYTLDGNSLVMTHYCAAGNQPRMRATSYTNDQLVFAPDGVSDLASPEAFYMSDMVLTFVGENRVNQTWRGLAGGIESEMPVFELKRIP